MNDSEIETSEKISFFKRNGIVALTNANGEYSSLILHHLRNELEYEFKKRGYPKLIYLNEVDNHFILDSILKSFSTSNIKDFFRSLSNQDEDKDEVVLFPFIHIMRNYFSAPQYGLHGWHNDSGGELPHAYCRDRLSSPNYVFGKLSIALQSNGSIGGNIDIATSTFHSSLSRWSLTQKISLKLQSIFFLLFAKSPSIYSWLGNQWLTDLFSCFTNPRTVNPKPLQVVAFDNRLFHRGTPISPQSWLRIKNNSPLADLSRYQLSSEVDLGSNNKFMIYAHFGNKIGLESYLYDRSKRSEWPLEKKRWIKQLDNYKIFSEQFPSSSKLFKDVADSMNLL